MDTCEHLAAVKENLSFAFQNKTVLVLVNIALLSMYIDVCTKFKIPYYISRDIRTPKA